jgi:putative tricarboxylic transport membrane protein
VDPFLLGAEAVFRWPVLAALVAGSAIGILTGVLPGIGPAVGIAVLLPATFGMEPLTGLSLLLGIYCGGWVGGAVPAVLINTPGTPATVATTFDGYPMARRGEATRGITLAMTASFIGGMISVAVLIVAAPVVARFTARFGAPEYLMAALLALVLVVVALRRNWLAAVTAVALGLFLSTVGIDPNTLGQRFTFGTTELMGGLPLVPVVIGLFGIAQALALLEIRRISEGGEADTGRVDLGGLLEVLRYPRTLLKSSAIGTVIGALPGIGTVLATFFAYMEARRSSPAPETFGQGNPEGIVAAEAANNAVTGASMIPVLTLGIPGDALTALIMGVFIIHSVYPGPRLFAEDPQLVYGIFISLLVVNLTVLALMLAARRWLARTVLLDPSLLAIGILAFGFTGAYTMTTDFFVVWIALGAGLVGYVGRRLGLPMVGLLLGLILGPMIEERLRQALSRSDGSLLIFLERPIALAILLLLLAVVLSPPLQALYRRLRSIPGRTDPLCE